MQTPVILELLPLPLAHLLSCHMHIALTSAKTPAELHLSSVVGAVGGMKRSILPLAFQNYKSRTQQHFLHSFFKSTLLLSGKPEGGFQKGESGHQLRSLSSLSGFSFSVASFPFAEPINYFLKFSSQIEVAERRQVEKKKMLSQLKWIF